MPTVLTRVRWRRAAAAVAVASALALSGCSSESTSEAGNGSNKSPGAAAPTGSINVFAAASLTGAFNEAKETFTKARPGLSVTHNFAGSNALVTMIQQGAPADVFASADEANMNKLVTAGLVEPPVTFARNKLAIAVAPGNPKKIGGLADLAKPDLTVVLAAPGVPVGEYTKEALAKANVTVTPKSLESDVKAALTKVTSGEADASVVYVTDVAAAGDKAQGVDIPDNLNISAVYPLAVVKATKNRAAADAFVSSATTGEVQRSLQAAGFVAP